MCYADSHTTKGDAMAKRNMVDIGDLRDTAAEMAKMHFRSLTSYVQVAIREKVTKDKKRHERLRSTE